MSFLIHVLGITRILFCISWDQTRGLYYKTIRISNLREMDRFRSKLLTFGSDNDTLAWTNDALAYYGVCRLQIHGVL